MSAKGKSSHSPPKMPIYDTAGATSGSSALGIRYDDGVMIASDTLVSFLDEKTYPKMQRVFKMNENLLLAGSGDFPDFQHIRAQVEVKIIQDFCFRLDNHLKPRMLTNWLATKMYERHLTEEPLSFDAVVGGLELDGTPYLASVDRTGAAYDDHLAATGSAIMCMQGIWNRKPKDREFTAYEAAELIEELMTMLYYRDTAAVNTYHVGICNRKTCSVVGPFKVNENWDVAKVVQGH